MKGFAIWQNKIIHFLALTVLAIGAGSAGALHADGGLVTPAGQRTAPPGTDGGMQGQDTVPGNGSPASPDVQTRKPGQSQGDGKKDGQSKKDTDMDRRGDEGISGYSSGSSAGSGTGSSAGGGATGIGSGGGGGGY